MSNAFASALFLARNVDKVNKGDKGRTAAVAAQVGSLVNKVSELDHSVGKGTQSILTTMKNTPKLSFGASAIEVAGSLVDPLLVVAGAYRVATSDDKEASLYKEVPALSGMFAAEAMMKKKSVNDYVKRKSSELTEHGMNKLSKIIKPLENLSEHSKNKIIKLGSFIITGAAMVAASIMGYSLGADVGKEALTKKRKLFNEALPPPPPDEAKYNDAEVSNTMDIPDKRKLTIVS